MATARRPQVLIVDDDDSVRHLERRLLIQGGYDVVEATSGAHALALINGGLDPELVIADLDMPGIPGEVMVQRIRAARPQQKVLYVTGKIHRVLAIPPDMRAGDLFLDKPFATKALLDAVAQVLSASEERAESRPALSLTEGKGGSSPPPRAALARDRIIKVLVVDDADTHSAFIRFALPGTQFSVSVADVDEGRATAAKDSPDVIVVSARRLRPSALELCRRLKRSPQRLIPIVLITADTDRRERMRAVDLGVDEFIGEPLDAAELVARIRVLTRVKRLTEEVDAFEQSLVNIALAVEGRDPSTEGHCQRLARYAVALGEKMQLSREDLSALSRGAYLHDIGKIVIPDSILLKPGALSRAEFSMMQTHPIVGERMCAGLPSLSRVRPIIRHHHERFDGSGYPDGLKGDDIPLLAEIIGLVDIYDALTTSRSYQAAMPFERAAEVLTEQARREWRRLELVQSFLDVLAATPAMPTGRLAG